MRIGTKGYGYTDEKSLTGDLKEDAIVLLNGKVYFNEKKAGGYREFKIHVQIIDNPNGLNYVVSIDLPYVRLHDLSHSSVSLVINNMKSQQSLVTMAHHFGHTVDTMLKTYAHLFTETEQALISEFDTIIENEMTSDHDRFEVFSLFLVDLFFNIEKTLIFKGFVYYLGRTTGIEPAHARATI